MRSNGWRMVVGAWRLGGVSDTPSLKWYKKGLGRDFEIGIVGTWFSGVELGENGGRETGGGKAV